MTSRLDHLPEGRRREIVNDLDHLLQLDQAALKGYEAALGRLDDEALHHQVATFHEEHERHARDLEAMMNQLGGRPGTHAEKSSATSGFKDSILQAGEDDREILAALRDEEERIQRAYDQFAGKEYPTEITRLLKRQAEDEHHHHDWAANTLRQTG